MRGSQTKSNETKYPWEKDVAFISQTRGARHNEIIRLPRAESRDKGDHVERNEKTEKKALTTRVRKRYTRDDARADGKQAEGEYS